MSGTKEGFTYLYVQYPCTYIHISMCTHIHTVIYTHAHTHTHGHTYHPPYISRYSPSLMLTPHAHPSASGCSGFLCRVETDSSVSNNNLRNTASLASLTAILVSSLKCCVQSRLKSASAQHLLSGSPFFVFHSLL